MGRAANDRPIAVQGAIIQNAAVSRAREMAGGIAGQRAGDQNGTIGPATGAGIECTTGVVFQQNRFLLLMTSLCNVQYANA